MNMSFLWNILAHPRTTILGLVGSSSAGAAFLYVTASIGCDWTQLSMQTISTAGAMIGAPAVVGGVMKDTKAARTEGDAAHDKAGQG